MSSPLTLLGWDDAWAAVLTAPVGPGRTTENTTVHQPSEPAPPAVPPEPPGPTVGRVARADRDSCDVLVADGARLTLRDAAPGAAIQRARRTDPTTAPVTGDWVVVAEAADRCTVERVLPRRSAVVRAQVGGTSHGQVLAANADVVAVVEGLAPDPDPGRVERLLALAWASGARPVVVLTKADLVPDPTALADDVAQLAPGADVLVTSASTGAGLEPLQALLADGATIALLGASGVGKSTLLNALVGDPTMRTRALRSDGKGRHTTVTRELHLAPGGGAVLDTPGMRSVGLAGGAAIDDVFPEVEELAARCRFHDCAHLTEPGCAVLAAVAAGTLPSRRLESYRKLEREAMHQAARTDARLRAELTQVWKTRTREYRRRPDKKR